MLDPSSELLRRRCHQALARDPGHADAHHVLAMLALMEEDFGEARARLETAVAQRAEFPEAHHNLGDLRQRMGYPLAAYQHFQLARRQDPQRYGTYALYQRSIACLQAELNRPGAETPAPLPPVPAAAAAPFLSVIVCSICARKRRFIEEHYAGLLRDTPHELILIGDARSLAEGYNRAVERSQGEILIFSHDDIRIVNPDFAARLCQRMRSCDVAGIAGTDHLDRPAWHGMGWPHVHGLCAFQDGGGPLTATIYDLPGPRAPIQALDGLFLAVQRRVLETHRFDEKTFTGFHLYDLDFTFGAFLRGFRLDICDGLGIVHASAGNYDSDAWRTYAAAFRRKYARQLARPAVRAEDLRWFQGATVAGDAGLLRLLALMHSLPPALPE